MARVFNFSPGPSTIAEDVLKKAAAELVEFGSSGQSVMEMSHRSAEYEAIIASCEATLRELMNIPDNYKVLFVHGGATMQFSMIPLNFLPEGKTGNYIVSGQFANKAFQEAQRFGNAVAIASSKADNYTYVPEYSKDMLTDDAAYLHICQNNTIYGTKFIDLPETGDVPLIADLSSCILSEPIDVSKYAMIYAGAQKNMGPAGVCVVIIREDMLGNARENTPVLLDYNTYAQNDSMYNTPSTYIIYMIGLVLDWVKNTMGGLDKMKEFNEKKAAVLYDFLDSSELFKPVAQKEYRSIMNVTFVTGDKDLDAKFCAEAKKEGLINIKGHRSVGGMRASIYNAMPIEGVEKLVDFMKKFEAENK